jgi:hypothetical protein
MLESMSDDNDEVSDKEMEQVMKAMKNLSYEDWKKLVFENDPEMKKMPEDQLKKTYNMMKKMAQNQ